MVYQRYTPLLETAEAPDHNCYVNYRLFVSEVLGSTRAANTCELTLFFSRRVPSGPAESAGRSDPEADHRVLELWLRLRVQPLGCLRLFL